MRYVFCTVLIAAKSYHNALVFGYSLYADNWYSAQNKPVERYVKC